VFDGGADALAAVGISPVRCHAVGMGADHAGCGLELRAREPWRDTPGSVIGLGLDLGPTAFLCGSESLCHGCSPRIAEVL
jgi:hypothetical protein